MRWEKAFASGPRRLARGDDEELPDHPDYLPTSLIAPRVGHMLRALASGGKATSGSVQGLAHAVLKDGDHFKLKVLADALDEADTGEGNDPARWIDWRNAADGIELDKRVLGAIVDRQRQRDEQTGNEPGPGRFATIERRAAHAARFGAPGVHTHDVMDALSPIDPNEIHYTDRQRLFPAVRASMDRLGQHGMDVAIMDDYDSEDPYESVAMARNNALSHHVWKDVWNGNKPGHEDYLKSTVRYEEPADIKFPGE